MEQITLNLLFALIVIAVIAMVIGYTLGHFRQVVVENRGEAAIRRELTRNFGNSKHHLLNNVTLPFEDGTTQIDHILVSRVGVFVVESKHYTGWIFGDTNSPKWTQVIYRTKHKFQNPLHQNAKHVRAVQQLLNFIPPEHVHSLVVFTGNAEFKTACPNGVVGIRGLVNYITSFKSDVMTENRMQFCVGRLECCRRLISRRTDVEHHAYLERKFGQAN